MPCIYLNQNLRNLSTSGFNPGCVRKNCVWLPRLLAQIEEDPDRGEGLDQSRVELHLKWQPFLRLELLAEYAEDTPRLSRVPKRGKEESRRKNRIVTFERRRRADSDHEEQAKIAADESKQRERNGQPRLRYYSIPLLYNSILMICM